MLYMRYSLLFARKSAPVAPPLVVDDGEAFTLLCQAQHGLGVRLGELMDLLEVRGADYIIFDGPPVLGLADAIVLANQVQSVLYMAQASQTRKSHIKDAFRRLRMAGIVPCGVVLTKTTAQNTAYHTYDSYYGYGASPAPTAAPLAPVPAAVPANPGDRTEPTLGHV